MSLSRTMTFGLIIAVTGIIFTSELTNSPLLVGIVGLGGFVGTALAVWYSPYPDSTHNFGMGQKRQQWGFTTEQEGDKWIHEPRNNGDSE